MRPHHRNAAASVSSLDIPCWILDVPLFLQGISKAGAATTPPVIGGDGPPGRPTCSKGAGSPPARSEKMSGIYGEMPPPFPPLLPSPPIAPKQTGPNREKNPIIPLTVSKSPESLIKKFRNRSHPKTIQHFKNKKPLRNILPAALSSLLLVPLSAHAENLVLNPGFEDDVAMPVEWKVSAVAN